MARRIMWGPQGVTFNDVPPADLDDPSSLADAQAVILGAPFDGGTSLTHRTGARNGPQAIRAPHSYYTNHLTLGVDPHGSLGLVDAGDAFMPPADVEESFANLREAVGRITGSEAIPVVLGGDHSIAWPDVSGVADVYGAGRVAVLHFDAHPDSEPTHSNLVSYAYSHGTPVRRLIESGTVRGDRYIQLGLRGYWPDPETLHWMRDQGMTWYLMDDILDRGLDASLDDAFTLAADGTDGAFLSIDIDVVDPMSAPGTGAPEPGGLLPRELLRAVRRACLDLDVVGLEVVEVSPVHDPAHMTSHLANRVVLEALSAIAVRRGAEDRNPPR